MFETGLRQLRLATATALGRPVPVPAVRRLIHDALATMREFGEPGPDGERLLDGPYADPSLRASLQSAALRRTARRLTDLSPFYRHRFAAANIDPGRLTPQTLVDVPVTTRADLTSAGHSLLCARPFLASQTTGTTAAPAQVWWSRTELAAWPTLIALSLVLRGELTPDDHVQLAINPLAAAAVAVEVEVCRLVGATCTVVGLAEANRALDRMCGTAGPPATVLSTYPSQLGALVTAARERGLGPDDFALHSITVGGELLSTALAAAARETFGVIRIRDAYGATEVFPAGGRTCTHGHLHMDPQLGYAEVLDLAAGAPAAPGALGTLVVTPYFPYRECQPVFRYDTRDLVRVLPEPVGCELAAIPAVSRVLGKAAHLLDHGHGVCTPRDLLEALDAVPGCRWPVRFDAVSAEAGLRLTVEAASFEPSIGPADVAAALAARGITATVRFNDSDRRAASRLRLDLVGDAGERVGR